MDHEEELYEELYDDEYDYNGWDFNEDDCDGICDLCSEGDTCPNSTLLGGN